MRTDAFDRHIGLNSPDRSGDRLEGIFLVERYQWRQSPFGTSRTSRTRR